MRKFVIALAGIYLSLISTAMAGDWVLAKEKDGITVYTRETAGSPVKEFKASTIMPVKMDDILIAIMQFEGYAQWYDHCKQARLISKSKSGSMIYHLEVAMPFPLSNRDIVCEMIVKQNEKSIEITIFKKNGVLDEQEGVVRMPIAEGSWTLTKLGEDKTEVIHQFKGDPAGNIPTSIVNMFLVSGPINTLTQLQVYLKK